MKAKVLILAVCGTSLGLAACGDGGHQSAQEKQVNSHAASQRAYIPRHDVELRNYNDAQKLYDSPSTIIWCSTTWGNASAPIVTVPVAGKLTSSTTTFFQPQYVDHDSDGGNTVLSRRSIDGLFHPDPPPYRYGFTPGGQYVDFFNMPTVCTTALTKFQRQQTKVSVQVDAEAAKATREAEAALGRGDKAGAQQILNGIGG